MNSSINLSNQITVKLGDLGYTYPGLSGKSKDDFGFGKPYIPYMNIFSNCKIKKSFLEYVDIKPTDRQNKVQTGDLFFTTSSETVEEVGMTSVLLDEIGEAYLNSFCFGFRLYNFDILLPEFAAFLFRGDELRKKISLFGQGSTRYNLPKTQMLQKLNLTLPDKIQQSEIAHILTTCDTVIEQTQSAIAKYKAIKQGLLHDLFTRGLDANGHLRPSYQGAPEFYKESELGMIPKEWEVKEFKKLIKSIDSGWSPICMVGPASAGEWGSLKTTAVTWDGYNPNENKKLPNGLVPRLETEVELDDFLITRVGPRERVGVIVHVNDGRKKLMVSDNMLRIKIIKNENLLLPFLALVMGSSFVQKEWIRKIAGLAEAQVVINQQVIRQTIFPLPGIDEQKAIFEKINCANKKIHSEETLLQKYQSIKRGLMSDLLGGKKNLSNHIEKM